MRTFLSALFIIALLLPASGQRNRKATPVTSPPLDDYFGPVKWRNIGPFRGGRSVASSGVIGDPLTYYMTTTGGGVWKTNDAGNSWANISDGYFKTGSVGAIAVSESDPNVVYVGMGEHAPRGVMTSYGDGVYKSTDEGKTWKKIGLEKTMHIANVVVHPNDPDIVYVAAQGALHGPNAERGVFKSTDGGETWSKVLFVDNNTGCADLKMDMTNPRVLYAAMWDHRRMPWQVISGGPGSGLYKSTDSGETWKKIEEGLPDELGKMGVAVSRSNPDKVYAIVESDTQKEEGGLFVSENGGEQWTRVSKDHRLTQRAWYYIEVFADPNDEHTVYVLSAPALRSIDGGNTWTSLGGTHGDFHDLWINPDNSRNMVISNDGGAAITFTYGKNWSRQDNMPTAQFYRVNADKVFPYRIYAGQQDNSSVVIQHRNPNGSSITTRNWTYSAGGESAFLAFDPDDPRFVLGGSYQGSIEALDTRLGDGNRVMAAPIQYLAMEPRHMKYRFNWNAPIIWSQHEPNTFYHGAQVLLKSTDLGISWEEVSPDLTRNQVSRQGKGGAPYTNEGAGGENYGTLSYVVESPHEKGVIWTGSDDGLIQVTRDGGANWSNVTPKGLSETLINAIEVSPHDPATVYIATTRYKFNDLTPAIYKSADYGQTWVNISNGIPYGAFARVVREDPERKGLLYAGTETGLYISYNDGQKWEAFQLNLPIVPITDLIIREGDLVASTQGRSFWVLDDLGLIRQYEQPQGNRFALYRPEDSYLVSGSSPLDGNSAKVTGMDTYAGVNPTSGVAIYYELPPISEGKEITLEIKDGNGALVRDFTSKVDEEFKVYDGGPKKEPNLTKDTGLNRFVWDMRYESMLGAPTTYIEGSYNGHKVPPGTYAITLRSGQAETTQNVNILANPLVIGTMDDYQEQHKILSDIENIVNDIHGKANEMMDIKGQVEQILKRLGENDQYQQVTQEGGQLKDKIEKWDSELIQRKSQAYDDVINFENGLSAYFLFLHGQLSSTIPAVTKGGKEQLEELNGQWKVLNDQYREIKDTDIPAFNKSCQEHGISIIGQEVTNSLP